MSDHIDIGLRHAWGGDLPFGLSRTDRRQHLYVIGQTGTGKSTLLRNLIVQDIASGEGVAVLDPHGQLSEELLDYIPPWRTDHVVYVDGTDPEYSVGLNLLAHVPERQRHLVASGVVSAFKALWADSWGPRLEYTLYACVAALLDCENVSLLGIQRMLADERYRVWVVRQVKDPSVRAFWTQEFESYDTRFLSEMLSPIRNKAGQLLTPPMRHVLGQVRSTFDCRFIMDRKRILIANLSKGRLGADKSNLLGSLLVTQFQLAAMSREDTPDNDRTDFYLYADEFANFATDSFTSILSEARKYRLSLTLAHQYLDQVPETIREAVFGNVGSLVSFRVGEGDAERLARQLGEYRAETLASLDNYELCAQTLRGGERFASFLGRTLPPGGKRYGRSEKVIGRSRQRYAKRRHAVDERIGRWMR